MAEDKRDFMDLNHDSLSDLLRQGIMAFTFGVIGRLLSLSRSDNHRLGWNLIWELPTAIAMGLVGEGAAEYLKLSDGWQKAAMVVTISYIGPSIIDQVVSIILRKNKA